MHEFAFPRAIIHLNVFASRVVKDSDILLAAAFTLSSIHRVVAQGDDIDSGVLIGACLETSMVLGTEFKALSKLKMSSFSPKPSGDVSQCPVCLTGINMLPSSPLVQELI